MYIYICILAYIKFFKPRPVTETYKYRSLHKIDWTSFQDGYSKIANTLLSTSLNSPSFSTQLFSDLISLLNQHAPLKVKSMLKDVAQKIVFLFLLKLLKLRKSVAGWKDGCDTLT